MNSATVLLIVQGIEQAARLATRGSELLRDYQYGQLTDEQVVRLWQQAHADYQAGRSAWETADEAGSGDFS